MSVNLTQQGIFNASGDVNANRFKTVPKSVSKTSYQAYQINMTANLVAGTTYTVQLWDVDVSHTGKTESNLGVNLYWGGGSVSLVSWQGTSYFTDGHADHLVKTFTPTSSQASGSGAGNAWINVYNSVPSASGTMNMNIGRWKLEEGSVATPWVPASTDNEYVGETCGFTELDTLSCAGKLGQECIQANNFIEW